MSIIYNDGKFVIYKIQVYLEDGWVNASLDYFGYPKGFTHDTGGSRDTTGIVGSFDRKKAIIGFRTIQQWNLNDLFRLVAVEIEQKTSLVVGE